MATESFSYIPNVFTGTSDSMYVRDHESLYWSVFALWHQVIKQRDSPGRFRVNRLTDLSVLKDTGGSYLGDSEPVLKQPSDSLLADFLVGQARRRCLWCPRTLFQNIYSEGMNTTTFNKKARAQQLLPCPPEVFEYFCKLQG